MSCSDCGTLLPAEARFCLSCGAPQTDAADTPTHERTYPSAAALEAYEPAVCEIGVWRGYVKVEFVATVRDGDEAWEVARSPSFRCRGAEPDEDDPRARAAYAKLLDALAREGWEPVGGGRPWYAFRFRRRRIDDVTFLPQALLDATRAELDADDASSSGDADDPRDRPPRRRPARGSQGR